MTGATDHTDAIPPGPAEAALERARGTIGRPFTDKETPPPVIDASLLHRFTETINRTLRSVKDDGTRVFEPEDVLPATVSAFGQGVWGPFQTQLDGFGGYLFGELHTTFDEPVEVGDEVTASARVASVDLVHGRRVVHMLRFIVAVDYVVAGQQKARSELTLLRLGTESP